MCYIAKKRALAITLDFLARICKKILTKLQACDILYNIEAI
nr:MAG TPA: hypothetical protein [Caudoviricetes sp.]